MTVQTELMVDATHDAIRANPKVIEGIPWVAEYVSGTTDIEATAQDWDIVPAGIKRVRIWQGYGPDPAIDAFDEIDIERGAVTPQRAAAMVKKRVDGGITWTNLYASIDNLAATAKAIQAYGHDVWNGHVTCRLADWNLNRAEATAKVGTYVAGMTCIGVQWASPTSNPNTILPGPSGLTLRQANVDLSVVDARWIPSYRVQPPTAPTAPVEVKPVEILAKMSDGSLRTLLTL